ncbi:MAG: beta-hydroxyacyl-ACP dehydratase [Tannerella sp.]|jgi:3-hydroxyacyl-[acyl-carrier-protein] dehydratase|nr:beta-hydroxyacyl-ACP dehydratase [Tannerella sp.]
MITLLDDYYKIDGRTAEDDGVLFRVTLLPEHRVYAGHFPGRPVSPGVCSIQMIKECAGLLTGKRLFLGYISQCRLPAVITPQTAPQLQIRMQLSETDGTAYRVRATVSDGTTTYVEFKGELTPVQ